MANRMTRKTKVIVAIAVVVAVALVGIVLGRGLSSPSDSALSLITWNETSLSELRGTPVVLNFWTTRCPACRIELPHLDAIAQQSREEIKVVAINVRERASTVQRFFGDYRPSMIIALDENGEAFVNYARAYNNTGGFIPFTLFVDSEGNVQYARVGAFASVDALRNALRDVLGVSIP